MQEIEEKVGGNIVRRQEMEEMEERVGGSIVTRRRRRNSNISPEKQHINHGEATVRGKASAVFSTVSNYLCSS